METFVTTSDNVFELLCVPLVNVLILSICYYASDDKLAIYANVDAETSFNVVKEALFILKLSIVPIESSVL